MANKKVEMKEKKKEAAEAGQGKKPEDCSDRTCPTHGKLKVRGRTFEGIVTKKFPRRVVIESERMVYVRKYERYAKSKTKIHARLPKCMESSVSVGDTIFVRECRPLSKMIHFAVIGKVPEKEAQK